MRAGSTIAESARSMKISIVRAHPSPGSFNHSIARTARDYFSARGDLVFFHDRYAERFDPVLPAA